MKKHMKKQKPKGKLLRLYRVDRLRTIAFRPCSGENEIVAVLCKVKWNCDQRANVKPMNVEIEVEETICNNRKYQKKQLSFIEKKCSHIIKGHDFATNIPTSISLKQLSWYCRKEESTRKRENRTTAEITFQKMHEDGDGTVFYQSMLATRQTKPVFGN
ncbi:hypothetical protein AVEN_49601-1 [Araneus ventricosus]|uniref:Uncharacterized protein n=1 Tax=Araneus ventricosus TaxID=182803 RepID=A0A4Y2IG53_ARAVE|nr:hypothetical protein AVEN_49601-1 [Araneus ventricosus]